MKKMPIRAAALFLAAMMLILFFAPPIARMQTRMHDCCGHACRICIFNAEFFSWVKNLLLIMVPAHLAIKALLAHADSGRVRTGRRAFISTSLVLENIRMND